MRSQHHSVGFYSLQNAYLNSEAYRDLLLWFERKSCTVDTIGLEPQFRGMKQFNRIKKRIEQLDLRETVALAMNSHAEGAKNHLEDCKLMVEFSAKRQILAISSRTDLYPRCDETLNLLRSIVERFQPEYGIGFSRNFYHGPTAYVYGTGCNETVSAEDAENLRSWYHYGRDRKVWRHGQIRDVYPWNFLNASQLNAKVGKQSLEEWIKEKSERGTLQPVGAGLTLWDLPEEQIAAMGPVLWDAGVIFDYRPLQEERLRNAPPLTDEEVLRWALGGRKPEEVRVLKVEAPGETRELSSEEVERLAGKRGQGKKR